MSKLLFGKLSTQNLTVLKENNISDLVYTTFTVIPSEALPLGIQLVSWMFILTFRGFSMAYTLHRTVKECAKITFLYGLSTHSEGL